MKVKRRDNPMFFQHPADARLSNFTFRDLKKAVVLKGMPFEEVVTKSVIDLNNYYREHFYDKSQPKRLSEFDEWQEKEIRLQHKKRGAKKLEVYATSPYLRLGYTGEEGESRPSMVKLTGSKEKKERKDRLPNGLYKGTKKSYTYELCSNGYSKDDTIKMVKERFPDAMDKSIGIWYNKAKKYAQNGCNPKLELSKAPDKPVNNNAGKGDEVEKKTLKIKKGSKLQLILSRKRANSR